MPEIAGVDFSLARPAPPILKQDGFQFVLGYCSNNPIKNLTAENVAGYLAAGLSVGVIWETVANRALSGAAGGAADGAAADAQLDAIGYPVDCVLFFAVDFNATAAEIAAVAEYAAAFDAHTKRPVGVYGSYAVVEGLVTPGQRPVRYGWQTGAWSGTALSGKAHIYQRNNTRNWPVVEGTDENVLCLPLPLAGPLHSPANGPTPPPQPVPAPPPPPAPPAPPAPAQGDMVYGERSARVLHLQQDMVRVFPSYNQYAPTGFYGDKTTAGLAEFQFRVGIRGGDGRNVGPQTRAALARFGITAPR